MPVPTYRVDEGLKRFATEAQKKTIDAVNKHGSFRSAAEALGQNKSTVRDAIEAAKKRAALRGYSPEHDMVRPVPETHVAKGISTFYDKDGKVRGQWVKSALDDEKAQAVKKAALEAMAEDLPRLPPIKPPGGTLSSLCNLYTLTDCHVGMLAWHKEGGEDWDLAIAEKTLTQCFEHMVANSPAAEVGLVNQLGDFLHYDSALSPVTPMHGHVLDADGRMPKMVKTAVRILRHIVDFALTRHEKVIVLLAEGNHDISSSVWLRTLFAALYENEPRVLVIDSEMPYYAHQHGQTMLAFHHGHLKKNEQLPILFAAQFPVMWGATKKRYAHSGHRHHEDEKEHSGMKVYQHTTIAARDSHGSRGGWLSERHVTAITYHERFGEVARNTVTPEMLEMA